ncbi:MAG: hypothetical protein ACN4GW_21325 [Desulforhopalus sp.]
MEKLNSAALGSAAAIVAAAVMALISILSQFGIYKEAAQMMSSWHIFYNASFLGTLAGMAEAAASTFLLVYLFAVIHNKIVTLKKGAH